MLKISENHPLKQYNTFGIEAASKYFAEISSVDDLHEFFKNEELKSFPLLILGGGSNLLLTRNFPGAVLKINIPGKSCIKEDETYVYIEAGAGEIWHNLVLFCIEKNYAGIENLSLIPGCVGAAPMQNIGAYGVELKDVFFELKALDIDSGRIITFSREDCKFGYRESIFKHELKGKFIILSVALQLKKTASLNTSYGAIESELKSMNVKVPDIKSVSRAVCNIRKSKLPDPAKIGNAGSFFKNPTVSKQKFEGLKSEFPDLVAYPSPLNSRDNSNSSGAVTQGGLPEEVNWKLAAGWLIEKAGWKGKRFNNYGVHDKQALVLVNYGGARGIDLLDLSSQIIEDIKIRFGVELEREVNII